jgi:hypothetical protein
MVRLGTSTWPAVPVADLPRVHDVVRQDKRARVVAVRGEDDPLATRAQVAIPNAGVALLDLKVGIRPPAASGDLDAVPIGEPCARIHVNSPSDTITAITPGTTRRIIDPPPPARNVPP